MHAYAYSFSLSESHGDRPLTKQYRQARIAEILTHGPVHGQEELLRRLRAARIRVSQATLSRDLREMGMVRGSEGYLLRQSGAGGGSHETPTRVLRDLVRSAAPAGSLVVIKTDPGHAHALGVALDQAGWTDVVGTVAGDDTLFAAALDPDSADKIAQRIRTIVS